MGRLTVDAARLVGAIRAGHTERRRLIQALGLAAADLAGTVAAMRHGFRAAHVEMARHQRGNLDDFMSWLRRDVDGFRTAVRTDLSGARSAWQGASFGLARDRRTLDLPARPDSKVHAPGARRSPKPNHKRRRPRA